jgi:subtilisin family serine protease
MIQSPSLRFVLAGLLFILPVLSSHAAETPPQSSRLFHPTRVLVKGKSGRDLSQLHARCGHRLLRRVRDLQMDIVEIPRPGGVLEAVAAYQASGEVEFAEPDYILRAANVPDDPGYADGTLWALHNTGQSGGKAGADLGAVQAWDVQTSASNVIVAVVDSGIRYTHEDLAANMWVNPGEVAGNNADDDADGYVDDIHGINAVDGTGDPWDDNGHGTHVAGIIGAVGNNGVGTVGVAWNVQLMACKFMDASGEGATSDAVICIDYARRHGAHVINASWGGPSSSSALRSALSRAQSEGIIFVAAAGNDSQNIDNKPSYPASYSLDNVVTVAATTRSDVLASYSNFGAKRVALAAPGSQIYSTWNTSDSSYAVESGTSMATPYVSGVFALTKARFPNDTYSQLIQRVLAAVDPLSGLTGKCVSGGRVNLRNALGAPLITPTPVRLSVVADASAGSAQFSLTGEPGSQYSIEASADLKSWAPVFTGQASDQGTLTFADPDGTSAAQRYYRARLTPVQ